MALALAAVSIGEVADLTVRPSTDLKRLRVAGDHHQIRRRVTDKRINLVAPRHAAADNRHTAEAGASLRRDNL